MRIQQRANLIKPNPRRSSTSTSPSPSRGGASSSPGPFHSRRRASHSSRSLTQTLSPSRHHLSCLHRLIDSPHPTIPHRRFRPCDTMSSTAFAVQPIPPFNPAKHRKNLPPFSSISQIDTLSSPASATPAPARDDDNQNVRRYPTAATMAGSAYPSVFEIPNPHRKSNSFTRHELESVDKGLSEVHEEDRTSENNPNGKKRRAIEELERDGGGSTDTSSRRSSQESTERRTSNERVILSCLSSVYSCDGC